MEVCRRIVWRSRERRVFFWKDGVGAKLEGGGGDERENSPSQQREQREPRDKKTCPPLRGMGCCIPMNI